MATFRVNTPYCSYTIRAANMERAADVAAKDFTDIGEVRKRRIDGKIYLQVFGPRGGKINTGAVVYKV